VASTIISVTTNGKLYVIGEYNVLRPKGIAIIYGLDIGIKFEIIPSKDFIYNTREVTQYFEYENKKFTFESNNNDELIKKAIEITFKYLKYKGIEPERFNLNIVSDLETEEGKKFGFGSSSALITGVIKSILKFHELKVDKKVIFKLAVLTQIALNDLSSGGDLASALYGGVIYYRRYNIKWLLKKYKDISIVEKKWPHLKVVEIKTNMKFSSVWTKTSYKTKKLTYKISKKEYKLAQKLVKNAYHNLLSNNYAELKKTLNKYQLWLEQILKQDDLYTKELKEAIRIVKKYSLSGKISGAGGGDSIIFMYPIGFNFNNLVEDLKESNLVLFKN